MDSKMFFGFIKNQRGSMALAVAGLLVVMSAGVVLFTQRQNQSNQIDLREQERYQAQVIVEKMRALANFLVSSNVIVCKEEPFLSAGDSVPNKCRWTGLQYFNGQTNQVTTDSIGFDSGTYNENNFIVFNVDTSKIELKEATGEAEGDETQQVENTSVDIRGSIAFKLYDLSKDELEISNLLGSVPREYEDSDQDHHIVLIKINVKYGDKFEVVRKEVDGSIITERVRKEGFTINKYFAMRRPIAIPKITVNDAECATTCQPSVSQDFSPECRSDQSMDYNDEVKVDGKIVNLGPGVLYKLAVAKKVKFDSRKYPGVENPPTQKIDIMQGRDYLLPGEQVVWTDTLTCRTHKTTTVRNCRGGSCGGPSGPQEPEQHSTGGGTVSYGIDINPANAEVTNNSSIEPARLTDKVTTINGVPYKQENTVLIRIIPTH